MKYQYQKNLITNTLKRDMRFYLISILFLLVGVMIGSITVKILGYEHKKELAVSMNKFFQLASTSEIKNGTLLLQAIKNNFQTVFFIWVLSLTVIGIPFTMFMVSFKGFVLGFTVAFLVEGFGLKGFLFVLIAILPHNLVMIGCMLVLSAASLKYSLGLLRKNFNRVTIHTSGMSTLAYTATAATVFVVTLVGALLEAYVSSTITRLVSGMIIIN